jgi:glycosyltransferase involved in cell wall biosynthesis
MVDHLRSTSGLKVLHVYRTYFPDPTGGLQEAIRQICLATAKHGVTSRVFTLARRPEPRVITREEAEVHRFPLHFEVSSSGFSLSALEGYRALAREADVLHFHFPWPFADLLHLLSGIVRPCLVTYHSDIIRQRGLRRLYEPLMVRFLGHVDRVVATSTNYADSSTVLASMQHKLRIIPLALDEASYPAIDTELCRRLEARYGRDYFIFVGVLRYYKGLPYLLEALNGTGLRAVIVGAGPEGVHIEKSARRMGLEGVQFAGHVDNRTKVALIALSRAMVFPSCARSEAFGVSLLEASMLRRPMITTDIKTGTTYVNIHGQTGLVVPPADPNALRKAMRRLHADPDLAARLGAGARQRFEQLFNAETLGARYVDIYRELARRPAANA